MATEHLPISVSSLSVRSDSAAGDDLPGRTRVATAFKYIDDPVCVVSMAVYIVNRFVLKPHHIGGWLVHDYLNDLLCLPIFVPIILRFQRALGIRGHDSPPTLFEIVHNWVVFSILYEFVFPKISAFSSVSDPWNSIAYLIGGIAAYAFWNRRIRAARRVG